MTLSFEKGAPNGLALTLAGFETFICFVDHVKTTTAAHQLIFLVAITQGFKRIADFHRRLHNFLNGAIPRSAEHMGQAPSCQAGETDKHKRHRSAIKQAWQGGEIV
jgi:hypothetical protein